MPTTTEELINEYHDLKHSIMHSTPYSESTQGERRMEAVARELQARGVLVPARPAYDQAVS